MMTRSRNSGWMSKTALSIATAFGLWLTQAQFTEAVPLTENVTNNTTSPVDEPGTGWDFDWASIKPSPKIVWHRCFSTYECARFQVPLDYLDTKNTADTAAIALIKYSSAPAYPEYSEKWGGPVLVNPGGPGGSGVGFVLGSGPFLQQIAGPQFSIIGFDPRGINNTRPLAECFDSVTDRLAWYLRGNRNPGNNKELIGEALVNQEHLEQVCSESPKRREAFKYMGAASVSRDMLEINEGIWDLAKSGVRRKGLHFWGFSYGSVLGVSFATLYPKKVERMVLDGIVDVHDFYSNEEKKILLDTEDVVESFFTFCSKAGPLLCSFHTGTKPSHVRARFDSMLAALRNQPLGYTISLPSNSTLPSSQLGVFNYHNLKEMFFQFTYSPLVYNSLSDIFVFVETFLKRGTYITPISFSIGFPLTCDKDEDTITSESLLMQEAYAAILCSDSLPKRGYTVSSHLQRLREFEKQTPTLAESIASSSLTCGGWKAQSKWKVTFPKKDRSTQGNGPEGAAPILFLSTVDDPVTPLANAYSMAKLFPKNGAFIGVQEGEGHCTISAPSACMAQQIASYFATGAVAKTEKDRFCAREIAPFLGPLSTTKDKRDEDKSGVEALVKIGEGLNKHSPQYSGSRGFRSALNSFN